MSLSLESSLQLDHNLPLPLIHMLCSVLEAGVDFWGGVRDPRPPWGYQRHALRIQGGCRGRSHIPRPGTVSYAIHHIFFVPLLFSHLFSLLLSWSPSQPISSLQYIASSSIHHLLSCFLQTNRISFLSLLPMLSLCTDLFQWSTQHLTSTKDWSRAEMWLCLAWRTSCTPTCSARYCPLLQWGPLHRYATLERSTLYYTHACLNVVR